MTTAVLSNALDVATPPAPAGPIRTLDYPVFAAHRCGAHTRPENTLSAARAVAAAHPGMVLEIDVQALGDGSLVVFHDETIDRLAHGGRTGQLKDMTARDWRTLRIKHPTGGEPAPASFLTDFLTEYAGTDHLLLIELKAPHQRDKFIETLWPHREQVMLASFSRQMVSVFVRSGFATMLLADTNTVELVPGVTAVAVSRPNITRAFCDRVKAAGAHPWTWGGSLTRADQQMHDAGLDGFILDDPST